MVFNKKAISPVVATALLLVVAVVAVVGFQSWFTTFQSKQLTDVELQTSSGGAAIQIERVQEDLVYILNRGNTAVSVADFTVTSADGDYVCSPGATPVSITTGVTSYACAKDAGTYVAGERVSVILETASGLVTGDYLAK